jgi:hypothetical protein
MLQCDIAFQRSFVARSGGFQLFCIAPALLHGLSRCPLQSPAKAAFEMCPIDATLCMFCVVGVRLEPFRRDLKAFFVRLLSIRLTTAGTLMSAHCNHRGGSHHWLICFVGAAVACMPRMVLSARHGIGNTHRWRGHRLQARTVLFEHHPSQKKNFVMFFSLLPV